MIGRSFARLLRSAGGKTSRYMRTPTSPEWRISAHASSSLTGSTPDDARLGESNARNWKTTGCIGEASCRSDNNTHRWAGCSAWERSRFDRERPALGLVLDGGGRLADRYAECDGRGSPWPSLAKWSAFGLCGRAHQSMKVNRKTRRSVARGSVLDHMVRFQWDSARQESPRVLTQLKKLASNCKWPDLSRDAGGAAGPLSLPPVISWPEPGRCAPR